MLVAGFSNLDDHMETEPRTFPHRKNSDGTIDSICSICYRTEATAVEESSLIVLEIAHLCTVADLMNVGKYKSKSQPRLRIK
jgi:hypothetical protein